MAQLAPEGAAELSDGRGWPPEMLHQAGQDPPEVGMRQAEDPAHLCLSFPIHHYSSDFKSVAKIQAHRIPGNGKEQIFPSLFPILLGLFRDQELIPPPQRWEGFCRIHVSGSWPQEGGSGWDQGQAETGSAGTRARLRQGQPWTLPIPQAAPRLSRRCLSFSALGLIDAEAALGFLKSHFHSFLAPLKAPLISQSMAAAAKHPLGDWLVRMQGPVGETTMEGVPGWKGCHPGPQCLWASVSLPVPGTMPRDAHIARKRAWLSAGLS